MHPLLLANSSGPVDASAATSWIALGAVGFLLTIGLNFFALVRFAAGKGNERQIEPTQLSSLREELRVNHTAAQTELRAQTLTLSKLDREMGSVSTSIAGFQREIVELRNTHASAIEGVHSRMGGISRELAATSARVDGLEKREGK